MCRQVGSRSSPYALGSQPRVSMPFRARVAEILGLPLSKVRVIGHYMGGAFGSKLQPGKYTIIAALLARITARPVKLFLTLREETFPRPGWKPSSPANMKLKAGVKRDGTSDRVASLPCLGTGGAYPAGGVSAGGLGLIKRQLHSAPTSVVQIYRRLHQRRSGKTLQGSGTSAGFLGPGTDVGSTGPWPLKWTLWT